jgi:hypothetical protein
VRLVLRCLAVGAIRGLHLQCLEVVVELVIMFQSWLGWMVGGRVGVAMLGAGVGGRAPSHLTRCLAAWKRAAPAVEMHRGEAAQGGRAVWAGRGRARAEVEAR